MQWEKSVCQPRSDWYISKWANNQPCVASFGRAEQDHEHFSERCRAVCHNISCGVRLLRCTFFFYFCRVSNIRQFALAGSLSTWLTCFPLHSLTHSLSCPSSGIPLHQFPSCLVSLLSIIFSLVLKSSGLKTNSMLALHFKSQELWTLGASRHTGIYMYCSKYEYP